MQSLRMCAHDISVCTCMNLRMCEVFMPIHIHFCGGERVGARASASMQGSLHVSVGANDVCVYVGTIECA